jgi:hypothetical protein
MRPMALDLVANTLNMPKHSLPRLYNVRFRSLPVGVSRMEFANHVSRSSASVHSHHSFPLDFVAVAGRPSSRSERVNRPPGVVGGNTVKCPFGFALFDLV